jgi:anthranilate/para-aminobenzoate synthase component I
MKTLVSREYIIVRSYACHVLLWHVCSGYTPYHMLAPSKKEFLKQTKTGKIPPLHQEMPYASPDLMYKVLASKNSFFLDSVKGPATIARYSFIGFDPRLIFKAKDGRTEIESSGKVVLSSVRPLNALRDIVKGYQQASCDYLPPFQGGLAGIFSYDFVQYFERLPKNAADDLYLPDAHFFMVDTCIAFDHLLKKCWIIVCPGVMNPFDGKNGTDTINWAEKYDEAAEKIQSIGCRIQEVPFKTEEFRVGNPAAGIRHGAVSINYEMKKQEYMDIVRRAKEYIAAGDIFQANLSQRVSACIDKKDPWNLYKILRSINPSPFAAFLDFGDYQIVSSSPERLVRVKNRFVDTRPIAGTRPRGRDAAEDEFMRTELLLNEKERAEHVMLIDLERNDLGRVSEYGMVRVDEFMTTEEYSHVIHIVSNVTGNLASSKDCFDAIRAAFPGGTITGVPKVRCMEIIDELEPVRRGPYTGSIGYIGFSGNMDFNIVIRTFVIKGGMAYVQAGAGIVADSDPGREYDETMKKAEALIRTLELA